MLDQPNECKSGICKGFGESNEEKHKGKIWRKSGQKPRYFNRKGESTHLCAWCWNELSEHPEKYLCKVNGCRVLCNEGSEFCFRHDKNTIIPEIKTPELE